MQDAIELEERYLLTLVEISTGHDSSSYDH